MRFLKSWLLFVCLTLSFQSFAQFPSDSGDDQYQPRLGQEGKDVIWMPTGNDLVNLMLKTAKVGPSDLVYDLGAGDGKIAIAAAKNFGARAVGIEFNPEMAALAQRNAKRAGVGDRVTIIIGDIFKENFSKATVVTLYLLPDLNLRLRPTILKMKPGTRVVSHAFTMGDWEPDQELDVGSRGFYWVVPANVAGEWSLNGIESSNKATLSLTQHYQNIAGNITIGNKSQPILKAKLEGDKLSFSYMGRKNTLHNISGKVTGNEFRGEDPAFYQSVITGKRQ
ncbi:MAG: class I SAM-dependent methyltransferase [Betaproteobacteria bacterium]|nr:class I SAM-dependent methyltransferase [Betaproteobacteria bacterium]